MERVLLVLLSMFIVSCSVAKSGKTVFILETNEPTTVWLNGAEVTSEETRKCIADFPGLKYQEISSIYVKRETYLNYGVGSKRIAATEIDSKADSLNGAIYTDDHLFEFAIYPDKSRKYMVNWSHVSDVGEFNTGSQVLYGLSPVYVDVRKGEISNGLHYIDRIEAGTGCYTIGLPWTQFIMMNPAPIYPASAFNTVGFIGLSFGYSYFYSNRKAFAFELECFMDHELPFPIGIDYVAGRWHDYFLSVGAAFTDNLYFGRFSFGYGAGVYYKRWAYYETAPGSSDEDNELEARYGYEPLHDSYFTLGPVLNFYAHPSRFISLGVGYRPVFVRIGTKRPFRYEHSICLDMKFNFGWKKRR